MDELKGAAKWVGDKVALAKGRDRLRIEDTVARLDEMDERAREFINLLATPPRIQLGG
jgi:hypothetical protein